MTIEPADLSRVRGVIDLGTADRSRRTARFTLAAEREKAEARHLIRGNRVIPDPSPREIESAVVRGGMAGSVGLALVFVLLVVAAGLLLRGLL